MRTTPRQVLRGPRLIGGDGEDGRGTCERRFQPHWETTGVSELFVSLMYPGRVGGNGGDSRLTAAVGDGTFVSSGCKRHQCPWSQDCAEVYRGSAETVNEDKDMAVGGAGKQTHL